MDKIGTDPQAGQKPAEDRSAAATRGSGEGSRTALEQLLQQERHRRAQQPREPGATGLPAGPSP